MAAAEATVLRRDVRDRVPVHWAVLPEPCVGVLRFRVGWADEGPIERGLTHLVEHLALHRFGAQPGFSLNGHVDALETVFWAQGEPDQVVGFLDGVCGALAALPLERIEAESRVLRTEALERQPGLIQQLQYYRYGARGVGLGVVSEHALLAPEPARVAAWAAERFTGDNAVAWIGGALPEDLRFDRLPAGERRGCPESPPLAGLRLPAFMNERPGSLSMSFTAPRGDWISFLLAVAAQRLQQRLRYDMGATYTLQADYRPVGPTQAHAMLWTACLQEQTAAVQRAIFEELERLAKEGPSAEELQRAHEEIAGRAASDDSLRASLDFASFNELLGFTVQSPEQLLAEFDSRDAAAWAAAMARALRTLLLVLPPGCVPSRVPCHPYPAWSERSVEGRRFRHVAQRYPWSPRKAELIVGQAGVSVVTPEGRCVTVRYQDCVGAVAYPDGRFWLCGEDGFHLTLDPGEWRDGGEAREAMLRDVPPARLLVVPRDPAPAEPGG